MTSASLRVARAEQLLTELGDKVITADELAAKLGICARTIYRYIRELRAAGYPHHVGSRHRLHAAAERDKGERAHDAD